MYRRIIVPLDGTAFGEYAVPFAVTIARRTGAALELAHVHTPTVPDGALEDLTPYQFTGVTEFEHDFDEAAARQEAERLREIARRLAAEHDITVSARVLTGHVALAIHRETDEQHVDLVVMATHARAGLDRARLGSVADDLVRHSDCPVLLVRPPRELPDPAAPRAPRFERVLVPLDGSEFSERILDPVSELLWWLGARVTLFQAVSPAMGGGLRPGKELDTVVVEARRGATEYLEGIADRISDIAPESRVLVVEARDAAPAILAAADAEGADLIAMATHGRGGLTRLLLGSTGDRVVHETHRPVLLFRPPPVQRARARGGLTGAMFAGVRPA